MSGTHLNDIHIGSREVEHRVASGHAAFAEHRQLLTNYHIPLGLRINFMNSLVRSRLTYGCHAWRPTQAELSKMDSTYNFILRNMISNGFKRRNPPSNEENDTENLDWGLIITNDSLHTITGTKTISHFYKEQQVNWISHVIRRKNNHPCKMLTFHITKNIRRGRLTPSILENAVKFFGITRDQFIKQSFTRSLYQ